MEKIEKKLKELEEIYSKKIDNLNQSKIMFEQLKTECINLEGKIQVLKELKNENTD